MQLGQIINKRHDLRMITDAVRLVNGKGDKCDGLIIDRYATHAVIYIYEARWLNQIPALQTQLMQAFDLTYMIVKDRTLSKQALAETIKTQVILNKAPSTTTVQEYGLHFNIDANDGLNAGLFLDMRHNRHAVGKLCKDKKVLNCFAYTCSFGVHAKAHGAREVVNVDLSNSYLKRGAENYTLNKLPVNRGEFLRFDAMEFLIKAVKKENFFDVIIIDPPSFARNKGKTFQIKRDLPKLIALGIAALNPSGVLMVSTNCSDLTHADLERMLAKGLNRRKVVSVKRISQDSDFVGTNTFKESYLVGLLIKVK